MSAVDALEGVDVELADVVPEFPDPRLDALEMAAALVSAQTGEELLETLVEESRKRFGCTWAVVVDRSSSSRLAASGVAPHASWVTAFVTGVSDSGAEGPADVAWAPLPGTGLVLVLGRDQARFRDRERRQLSALAGIAAVRYLQTNLAGGDPRRSARCATTRRGETKRAASYTSSDHRIGNHKRINAVHRLCGFCGLHAGPISEWRVLRPFCADSLE